MLGRQSLRPLLARGAPSTARLLQPQQRTLAAAAAAGGDYDLVVIGGGPGGYVAAIKAAQLGMKVRSAGCLINRLIYLWGGRGSRRRAWPPVGCHARTHRVQSPTHRWMDDPINSHNPQSPSHRRPAWRCAGRWAGRASTWAASPPRRCSTPRTSTSRPSTNSRSTASRSTARSWWTSRCGLALAPWDGGCPACLELTGRAWVGGRVLF